MTQTQEGSSESATTTPAPGSTSIASDDVDQIFRVVDATGVLKLFCTTFDRLTALESEFDDGGITHELAACKMQPLARDLRHWQRDLRHGLQRLNTPGSAFLLSRPWREVNNEFWTRFAEQCGVPKFVVHPYPSDLGGLFDRRLRFHLGTLGRKFRDLPTSEVRKRRKGKRKRPVTAA